jgi:SAM-dependent methyltransferase
MGNPLLALGYDLVLHPSEQAGLAERRRDLLRSATGAVLEIGAGTGLNVPHYPDAVDRLVLTDPDPFMRRRLRRRVRTLGRPAEIVDARAERLPFLENTFDEVVTTLVLCSVDARPAALHEARRVLRPRGRLRFLEHVAATPHGPSRLQRVCQPLQRLCAGGCRLDLALEQALADAGFEVEDVAAWSLPRAVPWVRPARVGTARAPA